MNQQSNPFAQQPQKTKQNLKPVKRGMKSSAILKFLALTTVFVILFILLREPIAERLSPSELPATGTQTQAQEGNQEDKTITERITESITGKEVTYSPTIQVAGNIYYDEDFDDIWVNIAGDTLTGDLSFASANLKLNTNNIYTEGAIISSEEIDILDEGIHIDEIEGYEPGEVGDIDAYQDLLDDGRLNNSTDSDILTRGQGDTRFLLANSDDTYLGGNTLTFDGNADFNGDMTITDQNIAFDASGYTLFTFSGNFGILTSGDSDDYMYFSNSSNAAMLLWDGYTANDPGFRINTASNELEYRDENEAGWTSFDSFAGSTSLWTDGGTYLYPTGNEDIRVANGRWVGVGDQANQPHIIFDNSNDYFEMIGGNVGIGTNTPGYILDINPGNSPRAINISYTDPAQSRYALYNSFNSGSNPALNYYGVYNNLTLDEIADFSGVYNDINFGGTSLISSEIYGLNNDIGTTALQGVSIKGVYNYLTAGAITGTNTSLVGVDNQSFRTTGSGSSIYGVRNVTFDVADGSAYGLYNDLEGTGAGTAEFLYGVDTNLLLSASDTAYGMRINDGNSTGGTVTGIYIDVDDPDSSNTSLYVANGSGISYFGNNVGIGVNIPDSSLDISDVFAASTSDFSSLEVSSVGSFDTTGGNRVHMGGEFTVVGSRSAGGSSVYNYGVWSSASGGQYNMGVRTEANGAGTNYGYYATVAGGSSWGVFIDGGSNYFSGDVGIGTFTISAKIDSVSYSNSTTGATETNTEINFTDEGIVNSGTDTSYGIDLNVTRTGATGGIINTTGLDIAVTGDAGGTSLVRGLNVSVSGATTNYAALFSGGNVGIGLTNPAQELEVNGDIRLDANGSATTNGLCHSGVNSDTTFADRDIVACSGAPADIAEWYDTKNGNSGDIVSTTGDTITYKSPAVNALTGEVLNRKETLTASVLEKTSRPYQSNVLGIISTSPYETFGRGIIDYAKNPNPIALTGRVPVKVSTVNGEIQPGDPITTSATPGVGMKATEPGVIIGRALDYYSDSNRVEKILLFVNISWYEPMEFRDKLIELLDDYEQGVFTGSLDIKDTIDSKALAQTIQSGVIDSISVKNATVTQDLRVDGMLYSNQFQTEIISAQSNKDIILKLSEHIGATAIVIENSLGDKVFSVDSTGKISIKSDDSNASVGTDSIPSGQAEVVIVTSAVTPDSKIFVTPRSNIGDTPLFVDEAEHGKFIVKIARPKDSPISFDWWIIN